MPITHILVIVDDQEGVDVMLNNLHKIGEFSGAHLAVTTTVQSAINILAVGCDEVSFVGRLDA